MTINHHLDEATLFSFGAGTLQPSLTVLVKAHLELCSTCRSAALAAAEIGGVILREQDEVAVGADSKSAVMDRISTATFHRLPIQVARREDEMPRALRSLLKDDDLNALKWTKTGPGLAMHKLPKADDEHGFFGLLRIEPGRKMPDHGHGGTELTLVLQGAYEDAMGHFGRGDIADLDESVIHTPVVTGDVACICLVANDAPTRFQSWPARLVQRFIGI